MVLVELVRGGRRREHREIPDVVGDGVQAESVELAGDVEELRIVLAEPPRDVGVVLRPGPFDEVVAHVEVGQTAHAQEHVEVDVGG